MKDGEIKNKLSPAQVSVMLHKVTEPPYFGKYWDVFEDGIYHCAACETPLFSSDGKFDSRTGWPSFKKPFNERDLQFKSEIGPDDKIEVRCKKCKSHLGYVISGDNPYYRINSVSLVLKRTFVPVPVAPITAAMDTPAKKAIDPDPLAIPIHPVTTDAAWSVASFLAGAIAGILVGVIGASMYASRHATPVLPNETSTVTEISSSTSTTASSTKSSSTAVMPSAAKKSAPTTKKPDFIATSSTDSATSTQ